MVYSLRNALTWRCSSCNALSSLSSDDAERDDEEARRAIHARHECPLCHGKRLRREALSVTFADLDIADISRIRKTFTLRTSEGFAETFGPPLIARIAADAPDVQLRFLQKLTRDSTPLLRERSTWRPAL